jgi:hypothetical protein
MIEDKTPQKTSISQLGEFGLIDHLTQHFQITQSSTLKGIVCHTATDIWMRLDQMQNQDGVM